MNLTPEQQRLVRRVLNVFETGRPDGDYGAIAIFADGPHDIRQITYGRSQTTDHWSGYAGRGSRTSQE